MTKKRTSPRQPKQASPRTMEGYAAKRTAELKKPKAGVSIAEVRPMIMHDPEGDLHNLMRAAEVKADGKRHKAAKKIAVEKIRAYKGIAGGDE